VADLPEAFWRDDVKHALWWMSPPCQPFTSRGKRRDLDDPRCDGLKFLTQQIARVVPDRIAIENVPGFIDSQAHRWLRETLDSLRYDVAECVRCPTELGIPMMRRRFYLVAARDGLRYPPVITRRICPWSAVIDPKFEMADCPELIVPDEELDRHRGAINVFDPSLPSAAPVPRDFIKCFTSAYAKSPRYSGSCLMMSNGCVRRFAPHEMLRLMGFGDDFTFPDTLNLAQKWALIGNSLSVDCVRVVLSQFPPADP
jgi:DNA (cytosine-5)-methyltransferase 1